MHKFSSLTSNTSGLEWRYFTKVLKSLSSSQNKKCFKSESVDICKVGHSNGKEYGAVGCRLSLSLTKITLSGDLMTLSRQLIFITSFSLCPSQSIYHSFISRENGLKLSMTTNTITGSKTNRRTFFKLRTSILYYFE